MGSSLLDDPIKTTLGHDPMKTLPPKLSDRNSTWIPVGETLWNTFLKKRWKMIHGRPCSIRGLFWKMLGLSPCPIKRLIQRILGWRHMKHDYMTPPPALYGTGSRIVEPNYLLKMAFALCRMVSYALSWACPYLP